ncbi:hypothetical protein P7K49_039548 [Saguinus oedipus]|uniref:Uncharacterized protein n=1 Tax=Saguinus oedipus TaxID=9490 RepID=A0ABQ9TA25_SAGOE|nr:hypothetical protein P7K49_039548 [Saguinus oedipus]
MAPLRGGGAAHLYGSRDSASRRALVKAAVSSSSKQAEAMAVWSERGRKRQLEVVKRPGGPSKLQRNSGGFHHW